jgi:hypothetical protein
MVGLMEERCRHVVEGETNVEKRPVGVPCLLECDAKYLTVRFSAEREQSVREREVGSHGRAIKTLGDVMKSLAVSGEVHDLVRDVFRCIFLELCAQIEV